MSMVYQYVVESRDGRESSPFPTAREAYEWSLQNGHEDNCIIEYQYEFRDTDLVCDFGGHMEFVAGMEFVT